MTIGKMEKTIDDFALELMAEEVIKLRYKDVQMSMYEGKHREMINELCRHFRKLAKKNIANRGKMNKAKRCKNCTYYMMRLTIPPCKIKNILLDDGCENYVRNRWKFSWPKLRNIAKDISNES